MLQAILRYLIAAVIFVTLYLLYFLSWLTEPKDRAEFLKIH